MAESMQMTSEVAKNNAELDGRNILKSTEYQNAVGDIPVPFGKRQDGTLIIYDMHDIPHMLVCGFTGSGKTAFMQTVLVTILNRATADKVRLIIYDSKMVEYAAFQSAPYMYLPIITDSEKLASTISFIAHETKKRLMSFAAAMKKDLYSYNALCAEKGEQCMPELFFIIDDFSDANLDNDVAGDISEILRNGRIAGIHLIIISAVTSSKVLKKDYLSNIPCKVTFCLANKAESKLIIEAEGAEKLYVPGEMIVKNQSITDRCQSAHAEGENIDNTLRTITAKEGSNLKSLQMKMAGIFMMAKLKEKDYSSGRDYSPGLDEYIADAGALIIEEQKASIGLIQRRFKLGFNRASRIMDQLCELGVVGDEEGTKPRRVLVNEAEWDAICNDNNWENTLKGKIQTATHNHEVDTVPDKVVSEDSEEPKMKLRNFMKFELSSGAYLGVSNHKIKYGVPMLTRTGMQGTLRAEFDGPSVTGMIFKRTSMFSKGYLQFEYNQNASLSNENPMLISINRDNVSNLTKIEFTREEEDKVWAFATQISEDIQLPITVI
nr:FtsK/SpoIIIE domain-containing protein [uncultured Butyrivibrio sp.]